MNQEITFEIEDGAELTMWFSSEDKEQPFAIEVSYPDTSCVGYLTKEQSIKVRDFLNAHINYLEGV